MSTARPSHAEQLEAVNEELRTRNRQQSCVAALGQAAIRARDLGALMTEAAAGAAETLGTEHSAVLEIVSGGEELLLRAGRGWKEGLVGHHRVPAGAGMAALLEQDVVNTTSVIIRGRAGPWGTLGVHTARPRSFSADDVGFLQSVANVLALAIERHEVEVARRRQHETLEAIFDNIPVMISFYDASGRLLRVNREWERTLGWTLAEAQRVDILAEAYPDPERRREVYDFIRRAERRWADFRPRTRDGRVIDASWVRFRLSDGSAIGFGMDITERKRAEAALAESEARFAKLFQASPVALGMSTIEEGRIVDVNEGWLELFGYRRDEVIGRTNAELQLSVDPEARTETIRRVREEGVVRNLVSPSIGPWRGCGTSRWTCGPRSSTTSAFPRRSVGTWTGSPATHASR